MGHADRDVCGGAGRAVAGFGDGGGTATADLRAIVIVQTVRVVVLAVGVPGGLALLGLAAPARLPAGALSIVDAPVQFLVLAVPASPRLRACTG